MRIRFLIPSPLRESLRWFLPLVASVILVATLASPAAAQRGQLGPQTNYSASEIATAVRNSGLNPYLIQYADQMGNLGRFESGGNAGVFNGSCCTGIFQLNTSNLRSFGLTREQYANMGLQEQVNVWAQLNNRSMGAPAVQQLIEMQRNGQAINGYGQVDGALVMSCIQLGVGNCQKMVSSGDCSGFSDINGTTICKMAEKMRNGTDNKGDPNKPTEGDKGSSSTPTPSTTNGNMMGDVQDKSPAECWGCDAVTIAFTVSFKVAAALTNELVRPALPLLSLIFGIAFAVTLGKAFFFPTDGMTRALSGFWRTLLRFVLVMMLIGSANIYTSVIIPYVVTPTLGISADLAEKMGDFAAQAFGGEKATGGCSFKPVESDNQEVSQAGDHMARVMCSVHLKMTQAIQKIGKATLTTKNHLTGVTGIIVSFVILALAFMGMVALVSALVILAFQIVEGVLRLGFCIALLPFAMYLWIYKPTESIFYAFLRNIVYGGALLVIASIMAGAATGMASLMVGIAGEPGSFGTGASELPKTVKYVLVMAALGSLAATMLSAASPLATQITGASGELAQTAGGAVNAIMQGVKLGFGVGSTGTALAGHGLGKIAAKFSSGAKAAAPGGAQKALTPSQKVKAMTVSGAP